MNSEVNGTFLSKFDDVQRIHLDSNVLIYFIEKNPKYHALILPIFRWIDEGRLKAVSSTLSILEVLVHPLRQNRADLAADYRKILLGNPHLTIFPVDTAVAEEGATIRANSSCKTPDAIQLATALKYGAEIFLTNDRQFRSVTGLEVILLDDFVA